MRRYKVTGGRLARACAQFIKATKVTRQEWQEYLNKYKADGCVHNNSRLLLLTFTDKDKVPEGWHKPAPEKYMHGYVPLTEKAPEAAEELKHLRPMPGRKIFCASIGLPITHNTLQPQLEHHGGEVIVSAPDDREPKGDFVEIFEEEYTALKNAK